MTLGDKRGRQQDLFSEATVGVVAEGLSGRAAIAESASAELAAAAGDDRVDSDAVAEAQVGHAFTERHDLSGELVSGDDPGLSVFLTAIDTQVGRADAGRAHFDDHFSGTGLWRRDIVDPNFSGPMENKSSHVYAYRGMPSVRSACALFERA